MSNIIRSAKSGSEWTVNELLAYDIVVHHQSSMEFFGFEPKSSLEYLDPHFVQNTLDAPSEDISDQSYRLLQYLDLATRANSGQESAIDDFAKEVLRVTGFEERGTLLRSRYAIPFTICGDSSRSAQSDVCLIHGNSTILLIIQEDKTAISSRDPEPQVIAEAIATFQYNNRARAQAGLVELETMTIPCITMVGTRPIFYKIPVTSALNKAVITAQYPVETTHVAKCVVAPTSRRLSEGMEVPEFRKLALQHYDAFRTVAKSLWCNLLPRENQ
ncbi:hypothetical protein COEREDRAFT_84042 [Coemansia reversa NRRL 1564]|uniref:Uncharacterized protein n=1 Tax=Coemansia reversa (strain ATCC 12441 / NRRL 1564) TaxID=763665 RepID=A0A2G5B0M1_COERN|nr:hypothetical protein COEREDRAFT_84042 [Coemansia reversa NRRL 1564]|eukprot:PIA12560.1 hypothetical protein COEREDRAFT_84042 [Coemansia reversa NRRL 1564]